MSVANSLGQITRNVFYAQKNAGKSEIEEIPPITGERIIISGNKQRNVNIVGNNSQHIELIRNIARKNAVRKEVNSQERIKEEL